MAASVGIAMAWGPAAQLIFVPFAPAAQLIFVPFAFFGALGLGTWLARR
jgi:hypothetical protein